MPGSNHDISWAFFPLPFSSLSSFFLPFLPFFFPFFLFSSLSSFFLPFLPFFFPFFLFSSLSSFFLPFLPFFHLSFPFYTFLFLPFFLSFFLFSCLSSFSLNIISHYIVCSGLLCCPLVPGSNHNQEIFFLAFSFLSSFFLPFLPFFHHSQGQPDIPSKLCQNKQAN